MKAGWIQLHKSLIDWEWYDDANTMRVFIHCCLRANYEDKEWRGATIKRGTFITSVMTLSKELKLSESKIRLSIKKLKTTNEITIKTTNKFTTVTICNYDTYNTWKKENDKQDNEQHDNQTTIKQQSNNNQTTTDKKDNNNKKKKIDIKHLNFCEAYLSQLKDSADNGFIPVRPKSTRFDSKEWTDSIRLLENSDGYKWEDIISTVKYYFHVEIKKQDYRIEAFSVKSFRSKYQNILGSKMRYDNEHKNTGPENR
jgi:hypothetical protein